ncbi:MAG: hypothetical protein AABX96_03215 [Nanoarchaeota archaeon]
MVSRKRPYESSKEIGDDRVTRVGDYHRPRIIDMSPVELDQDEINVVEDYILHHTKSDRLTSVRDTDVVFD